MDQLAGVSGLVVVQRKEWGEILTGFETVNKYVVLDTSGRQLYLAAEEGGSLLLRWFLKAMRPFTMAVLHKDGRAVLRVRRPFRFYFHCAEVVDASGRLLGTLQRRFSLARRIYSVLDTSGREQFELFGPILHPWTFEIRQDGREVGKITKKWSGLTLEAFTDADKFGVTFPADWDVSVKAVFLGAVFLIDFVHFENQGN
ncbi:MAG: scramblase [Candidatus Anammoximicrobium sp.]|nr:scramblase [Candidatus Anammoximicrobium sp.]